MNRQLLDPFEHDYPDRVVEELHEKTKHCKCLAFNRRGTLLATGCHDGSCVLWDFDTRAGPSKILHEKDSSSSPVVAVSWSLNGRRLLTAEEKGRVRLWDVEKGTIIHTTKFDSVALTVQINPRDPDVFLACPNWGNPVIINIKDGTETVIEGSQIPDGSGNSSQSRPSKGYPEGIPRNYSACWESEGSLVYVGSSKGLITIWEYDPALKQIDTIQLPSTLAVRNFSFTQDGNYFLTSDSGKIRVYDARGGTLHREFVDLVNRTQWRKCVFSADGNYVLGATSESGKHEIYVWNRDNGNLIIHLKGPMSSVLDLQWHPSRPIIASTSQSGTVMVWSKQYSENYSAFAPNFKELEENEEYIEREDEFDLIDDKEAQKKKQEEDESTQVDVTTVEEAVSQFNDVEDELIFLPAIPDKDPELANPENAPVDPTPDAQIRVKVYDRSGREVSCYAPNAAADAGGGAVEGVASGGGGAGGAGAGAGGEAAGAAVVGGGAGVGQEGDAAGGEPDAKRPRVE